MEPKDYEKQATDFLTRHGLKLRATFKGDRCPPWAGDPGRKVGGECPDCGTIHGARYRVTIWRQGGGRLTFDFWNSLQDSQDGTTPTAYDVLACISGDYYTPETCEEFCGEYGEDTDSRKALALFRRCDRFARRLRAFFTEAEAEALGEIQ